MMSAPVVVFPDAELAATRYLRERLDGTTVTTEWPASLADRLPVVAVSRSGGAVVQPLVTEDVTFDIDILAPDKATAQNLAQQVRGLLFAAQGEQTGDALIYRVRDISLVWLPHHPAPETDPIPRYVLVMQARIRAA